MAVLGDFMVWVNNAWVNWVWEGNPGLIARMTFIFREDSTAASGLCLFELHSSALPEKAGDEEKTPREKVFDSSASGSQLFLVPQEAIKTGTPGREPNRSERLHCF